jgi:hypothetical protein
MTSRPKSGPSTADTAGVTAAITPTRARRGANTSSAQVRALHPRVGEQGLAAAVEDDAAT